MSSHLPNPDRNPWYWGLAVVLGVAALGGGCDGSSAESRDGAADVGDSALGGKDAGLTCSTPEKAPTFALDVKPFLNARCNVCHSSHPRDGGFAPQPQNFETYAGFKPWAEASLSSMLQGSMPPPESDPAASAAEMCLLKAWIDQGAKDD